MYLMKSLLGALFVSMVLLLSLGCSSKLLTRSSVEVIAKQEVRIDAREGAEYYQWKQISGIEVILSHPNVRQLQFVAPDIQAEEHLVFELTAKFGDTLRKARLTVIVKPQEMGVVDDPEDADVTAPVITLNGEANISLVQGSVYRESGATAIDEKDGNLSVVITGSVNTTEVGTYVLTYTATDRAGNQSTVTRTVTVTPAPVTLRSLILTVDQTRLSKDANTTLHVVATYSDQTTKDVTDQVTWQIDNPTAITIRGDRLIAKQDKPTTLRAKLNDILSNEVSLDIYWEVNGHRLPPEPDKATNDATLLGVDINDNGVRDDVERWIYDKYKDKHPIHIDIAMQAARAYKLVLETPEMAKEIHAEVSAPMSCEAYYSRFAKYYNEPLLVDEDIINEYFMYEILYDTKERREKFEEYDRLLSGGTYVLPTDEERKALCDFNTNKYKE